MWDSIYFGSPSIFEVRSPNAQLFAAEQDHNLALRRSNDSSIERLAQDRTEKAFWSVLGAHWSPDSRLLAASKIDQTEQLTVLVVRWLEDGEPVDRFPVTTAGKPFGQKELWILKWKQNDSSGLTAAVLSSGCPIEPVGKGSIYTRRMGLWLGG